MIQRFWSRDGESTYSHAGIILDAYGTTFEALWTVKKQNLFKAYANTDVLVARYIHAKKSQMNWALRLVEIKHLGQIYPFWRLLFQLFPPMAKYISFNGKWVVCSELVAQYLFLLEARHAQFLGTTPDILADEASAWRNYRIVYEGRLE